MSVQTAVLGKGTFYSGTGNLDMTDQIQRIQGVVRTPLAPLCCPPYREFVDDMA